MWKMNAREALQVVLDSVDYTAGNCRVNEMVGAVLPRSIILLAREAIEEEPYDDNYFHAMELKKKLP